VRLRDDGRVQGQGPLVLGGHEPALVPLGHFHITGAATPLPGEGGPDPERGIDFDYFVGPDGFARPTCQMPGEGPTPGSAA
jgi:hypothetical protein